MISSCHVDQMGPPRINSPTYQKIFTYFKACRCLFLICNLEGEERMMLYKVQEVCKKTPVYTGSNFLAKASGPPSPLPLLLYAVRNSHALCGRFPFPAVHFQ